LRFLQSGNLSAPLLFTNALKNVSMHYEEKKEAGTNGFSLTDAALPVKLKKAQAFKNMLETSTATFDGKTAVETPAYVPKNYQQRFLVKNKQKLLSIKAAEVALFYAEGRLNFLKTKDNRKFIMNYTMEMLSHSLLDPDKFFRINRSMIISFDDIKDIFPYFGGRVKLLLHTPVEKEIVVSRDKVSEFKKWLGE
jgi:DNA-binding LytR/AlgR family response regulator